MPEAVAAGRRMFDRPLTLAEKILVAHLDPASVVAPAGPPERGRTNVGLHPDRVAMQDATAQMAILQFMTAGLPQVLVPTTVHCDHLIAAEAGAEADLLSATITNHEVYDFLRTAAARYGMGFWAPGSGIIHQVVLEQYAFPGGLMIGTDSHTPNAGGLGMVAIGVGGADAVDVMTGSAFGLTWPRMIGIYLGGRLSGWTSPKDVILRVAEMLTVSGGTGAIVEYFGPGVSSISATGRATIANMGAEIGATGSVFGFDERTVAYLNATGRQAIVVAASSVAADLAADLRVGEDPEAFFDAVYEVDLSALEPQVVGPRTPDLGRSVSDLGTDARRNGWPLLLSNALVGSCTNSSYEDIARAASVARQASAAGMRTKTPLLITPGSELVRATIARDGLLSDLEAIGAQVLANACGPCIGQWVRSDGTSGQPNSIMSSFNRNFPRRNDGNAETLAFVASPETTVAYALAGTLDFDPTQDTIDGLRLTEPHGDELPPAGFLSGRGGYFDPPPNGQDVEIVIHPASDRLQRLTPFEPWDGEDFLQLVVLLKAQGKCTTDHISAAGPWLKYRGHLENISANLFLGAFNAFTGEVGTGWTGPDTEPEPLPTMARRLRDEGCGWIAVGDENYGEGSSREHAAMEPRLLGCKAVLVRSFARIHETNLKKQGVLPLTFADPTTYDSIGREDTISILGLVNLAPHRTVAARLHRPDGSILDFECGHTLDTEQIAWFAAGSALNLVRQRLGGRADAPGHEDPGFEG